MGSTADMPEGCGLAIAEPSYRAATWAVNAQMPGPDPDLSDHSLARTSHVVTQPSGADTLRRRLAELERVSHRDAGAGGVPT